MELYVYIMNQLIIRLVVCDYAYILSNCRDNPINRLESSINLLVLAAALRWISGFNEFRHLLEYFTCPNSKDKYLRSSLEESDYLLNCKKAAYLIFST